jgi:hypothetical protein
MKTSGFMHSLNAEETQKMLPLPAVIVLVVIVVIGGSIGGYLLANKSTKINLNSTSPSAVQTDTAAGVVDKTTFKDSAEGILREGGIEGEGNFHIERPGGVSQHAYLTSSTVDLSKYVGKKVKVWGQTFQGQKAGWLMDVGLIEIK